ncbi:MAG: MFS transporter [Pseudomonadota bacterium]
MNGLAKLAILSVAFVDIIGQGLVFPIINTLVMDASSGFLPAGTPTATRHLAYGVVIGAFFLAWFFGAPYISMISDRIGRKRAILICLAGALAGYAITIAALYAQSLPLLVLGRVITGFTAGNRPIAQAAMVDGSAGDADRGRNMGYLVTAFSAGLIGGPIIGAVFSNPSIVGSAASLKLPFMVAFVLMAASMVFVALSYHDVRAERGILRFSALELIEVIVKVRHYDLVLRISAVLMFFHISNLTFYVMIDNYMATRFGYGMTGTSAVMLVIGAALALSSTFLVAPIQNRYDKRLILQATFLVMALSALAVILSPSGILTFIPIFLFYFFFGFAYPTLLSLFSLSVNDDEQGWVMGITMAVFTFAGGLTSILGGWLIAINVDLPFYVVIVFSLAALGVIAALWRNGAMRTLTARP